MVVGPFGSSDQPRENPPVFQWTLEVMLSATRKVAGFFFTYIIDRQRL